MLAISEYSSEHEQGVVFSEAQASRFAKAIAGDFNPIHDEGAKRFCVPGDLLFAVLLDRYGVYESTSIDLMSLVSANSVIVLPEQLSEETAISDSNERHILTIGVSGESHQNKDFVAELVQEYVQFSGKTFPDILVGLMRDNNAMINPSRPLVIYKDMSLKLNSFDAESVSLKLSNAKLDVDGKKGAATLQFEIHDGTTLIGTGEKNMVLGGLREYDEAAMTDIVAQYNEWKSNYGAVENEA